MHVGVVDDGMDWLWLSMCRRRSRCDISRGDEEVEVVRMVVVVIEENLLKGRWTTGDAYVTVVVNYDRRFVFLV